MVTSGTVSEENLEPDSTGTVTGSHQYYEADDYTVSLTVTDKDAGSDTDSMIVTVKRIPVPIDIMPGGYPNAINLKKKGLVAVALLNDPTWTPIYIEPTMIDPATLKFMGANPIRWTLEDVDSDGDMDLLLHYKTRETTICVGDTDACIFGDLYDQRQIEGIDSIKTP